MEEDMFFTRQTLAVFQDLLSRMRWSVTDQNADLAWEQLKQARNELIQAANEPQPGAPPAQPVVPQIPPAQ
jgi:hypothetical protein